ncbi:peptidoglycan DD-metalloendopeptidase family protein [Salinimicrobium oceani]|uniref:Peptidoglycan DD-metalloendopeptidase family protein n=1 Tax=Salinimicrobium oceani TaxID=2722702 RepID=A0ABX1D084_9FLAO|nr:peptidoglycan DD-metalloendopeptidase family protein [Salinimicrobium oceani]NJW53685.1 peptidoglycan DD-metalloendopeptidase family protein [Salinimicrobium oceani]
MSEYKFLTGLTSGFTPVIDAGFSLEDYRHIDLSVQNEILSQAQLDAPEAFQKYLDNFLLAQGGQIPWGGYNEHRGLYRRSGLFSAATEEDLIRNIHIGLDVWAPVGTGVLAVLDGRIHSFKDNNNFGDYGPTIILEHEFEAGKFYTLYGHLQRESLKDLQAGEKVKQGERIAALGDASENGNYAPHLHFQIIHDLQGKEGDYPGVANRKELEFYLSNCPDPNLLLKMN